MFYFMWIQSCYNIVRISCNMVFGYSHKVKCNITLFYNASQSYPLPTRGAKIINPGLTHQA